MIKIGKIHNSANTSGVINKPFITYGKKHEGEINATAIVRGRETTYHAPYQQVAEVASVQQQKEPFTIPIHQQPQQHQQQ